MTVIMYAAPLKDCKWNDTQVVDIVKHVNIFCSLLSKTKCVHQWLYIKQTDNFVCILFYGFSGMNRESLHNWTVCLYREM